MRKLRALKSAVLGAGASAVLASTALGAGAAPPAAAVAKPVPPVPLVTSPWLGANWHVVARIRGRAVAWSAHRGGVALLRFDQHELRLELHPGAAEPGGGGWTYPDQIGRSEVHSVVAGFNAGFKFSYGSLGFMEGGRTAVPLQAGLASVVTYRDGSTQIGAWRQGVPAAGKRIVSVRQNLHLLIEHGSLPGNLENCVELCWGATDAGLTDVARSALGITASGELVWGAGMSLSPIQLARALQGAGARRAIELDINPEWVAGFVYEHRRGGPVALPVVPGQGAIPGRLFSPYQRDFFTIVAK